MPWSYKTGRQMEGVGSSFPFSTGVQAKLSCPVTNRQISACLTFSNNTDLSTTCASLVRPFSRQHQHLHSRIYHLSGLLQSYLRLGYSVMLFKYFQEKTNMRREYTQISIFNKFILITLKEAYTLNCIIKNTSVFTLVLHRNI